MSDLPDRSLPGGALSLIAVTQVAEYLLDEIMGDNSEVDTNLLERAVAFLGISNDDLDELRHRVASTVETSAN